MLDPTRAPRLLKFLSLVDRAGAFARRRNAGRQQADHHLAAFYETVWKDAAAALGADIEALGHGVFEIRRGDGRTRVLQNSTAIDDLATHCVVRTKPAVYRLLRQHGLPTPPYAEFSIDDMRPAVNFLEQINDECVIKPAEDSGGGAGVTTGIRTRWQLARAAWAAAAQGNQLLIEEQLEGENYRLLYLDGKLLDAVARRPPTVVGDGRRSVRQLVEEANQARLRDGSAVSHALLSIDFDMQRTLARHRLTLQSVPAAGSVVILKTAINENRGADNITVTPSVCDAIVRDGARAAAITGVRLAGVDIITRDLGQPLAETGGVVLEVNSPPGYYWHYHKRDGAFPVAIHVLEALLGSRQPKPTCFA